jgi:hypothetical protein
MGLLEKPDPATLEILAEFICGDDGECFPIYRSSSYLTKFFQDLDISVTHDGSTRKWWVLSTLETLGLQDLEKVILRLVDMREYKGSQEELKLALKSMKNILLMESLSIRYEKSRPQIIKGDGFVIENDIDTNNEEEGFLSKEFEDIDLDRFALDLEITSILKERMGEIRGCMDKGMNLSAVILMGSTLEGILLGFASKFPKEFNSAQSSPKKDGKVKKIPDWKLVEFINVAREVQFLDLDVAKYSHTLRDFRNYIHPYQQKACGFSPTQETARISWQVLRAAISQLSKQINL